MIFLTAFLIDSNIIAQWVLSNHTLDIVSKSLDIPEEMAVAYKKRYMNSIEFIDKILQSEPSKEREFLTYDFNLFEVVKALKDEIRTMHLFKNGVPLAKWNSRGEHAKIEVSDKMIDSVFESYNRAQDKLFAEENIGIISHPLTETEKDWEDYYSLYSLLMLRIPHLLTQDAMIVSACLYNEIDYLVTKDEDLKKMQEQIENALNGSDLKLQIIDPGNTTIWSNIEKK